MTPRLPSAAFVLFALLPCACAATEAAEAPPTTPVDAPALAERPASETTAAVAQHAPELRRDCWEGRFPQGHRAPPVRVDLTVAPSGAVTSARATGAAPLLGACVEGSARRWAFPPQSLAATASFVVDVSAPARAGLLSFAVRPSAR